MLTWPYQKDTFPYIELAKYHEHRLKDFERAMIYVDQALEQTLPHQRKEIEVLQQRRRRLAQKMVNPPSSENTPSENY
jgi:hypothetical protein